MATPRGAATSATLDFRAQFQRLNGKRSTATHREREMGGGRVGEGEAAGRIRLKKLQEAAAATCCNYFIHANACRVQHARHLSSSDLRPGSFLFRSCSSPASLPPCLSAAARTLTCVSAAPSARSLPAAAPCLLCPVGAALGGYCHKH